MPSDDTASSYRLVLYFRFLALYFRFGVKTREAGQLILAAVKPMRVLLFDVFGTLVDWRASLIELAEATGDSAGVQADWAAVVDDWSPP